MFMQNLILLQGGAKRALVEDAPKMDMMLDRVSQFLSDMLALRNASGVPLVEVARKQMHYLPTPKRVAQLKCLLQTYDHVCQAENLADRARQTAQSCPGYNIRLNAYTADATYFCDEDITKSDGIKTSTYNVGALGIKLMQEVSAHAMEWLEETDRVLSDAIGLERTEAASSEVNYLKEYLALAIAKRLCCVCEEDVNEDELSTSVLEDLIVTELSASSETAKHLMGRDVAALTALRTVAANPRSESSRTVLENHLELLQELVYDTPGELLPTGSLDLLQLDVLSRALMPGLDPDVRVALACFWAEKSGPATRAAVDAALANLKSWNPNTRPVSVVREVQRGKQAKFPLPRMTRFLHFNRVFVARNSSNRRAATDERGTRCVRLLNCVLELAVLGVFERGVLASEVILAVANDERIVSRIAAQTIINVRDAAAIGKDIMEFLHDLYDPSSDYSDTIKSAVCALSSFSVRELATVFDDASGVLPSVCDRLSSLTRSKLLVRVNVEYRSFASDMLALLLPLVEQLRDSCSIPRFAHPHPLADLLSTVAKARSWTPLAGTLRIGPADLKHAHSKTRATLDSLHDKGVLVTRTGGGKNKITYSFNTPLLVELFSRACAVA